MIVTAQTHVFQINYEIINVKLITIQPLLHEFTKAFARIDTISCNYHRTNKALDIRNGSYSLTVDQWNLSCLIYSLRELGLKVCFEWLSHFLLRLAVCLPQSSSVSRELVVLFLTEINMKVTGERWTKGNLCGQRVRSKKEIYMQRKCILWEI